MASGLRWMEARPLITKACRALVTVPSSFPFLWAIAAVISVMMRYDRNVCCLVQVIITGTFCGLPERMVKSKVVFVWMEGRRRSGLLSRSHGAFIIFQNNISFVSYDSCYGQSKKSIYFFKVVQTTKFSSDEGGI